MEKINLLFIEDNPVDQLAFKRFVKSEKLAYHYHTSYSLAEATQMLKKYEYQLILADISLGDGTAFELFKYIPDFIPVIFITATGCEDTAIRAIKAGVADYIVKEVDGRHLKKLPDCIHNVLNKQQLLHSHIEKLIKEHKKRLSIPLDTQDQENEFESLEALAFKTHICVTITDSQGNILRVNNAFTEVTGYLTEEVVGKNMSILKSGKQDKAFYKEFWRQITTEGKYEGEIWNHRKDKTLYLQWLTITAVYNADHSLTNYVAIMSDVTEKYKIEQQIRRLAFYDSLTSLANRRLLLDRIQHEMAVAKRYNLYGTLIFLDVDKFKALNDTHGHGEGDKLLVQVARRLLSTLREEDMAARLGGDEFVVLIHAKETGLVEARENAIVIAEKIRAHLSEPYFLMNKKHFFSSSLGVALYPHGATYAEELLQQADKAMYTSKNQGGNYVSFFHESLDSQKHLNILLIEDSVTDTLLSTHTLREFAHKAGFNIKIKTLANGEEAIAYLDELDNYPNFILLDLDLPKVDGFQVMAWLKNHEFARKIPVVVFTIGEEYKVIDKCLALNAKDYVEKPLTENKLQKMLHHIGLDKFNV